jgi:hypothetical protein
MSLTAQLRQRRANQAPSYVAALAASHLAQCWGRYSVKCTYVLVHTGTCTGRKRRNLGGKLEAWSEYVPSQESLRVPVQD